MDGKVSIFVRVPSKTRCLNKGECRSDSLCRRMQIGKVELMGEGGGGGVALGIDGKYQPCH